ncbi:MAG TPA: hypothetical protein PKZ24_03135, partial [Nitrospirales bacterium]|nr:hypothetical protein [Nitrospirales bacterium]
MASYWKKIIVLMSLVLAYEAGGGLLIPGNSVLAEPPKTTVEDVSQLSRAKIFLKAGDYRR